MIDPAMQAVINAAAKAAVAEYSKQHPCRFSDEEAGHVHALGEAMQEEGGNHHTIRIIVQLGNNYRDVTGQMRKWGVLLLFGVIFVIAAVVGYLKLSSLFPHHG